MTLGYFILSFLALALVVWYSRFKTLKTRQRKLNELRDRWGKVKNDFFNFEKIKKYDETTSAKPDRYSLSAQTMNDIDFNDLFKFLDRTNSKVGQQYLFHVLKTPHLKNNDLLTMDSIIAFFSNNPTIRESVQTHLLRLAKEESHSISSLLAGNLPKKPSWYNWLIVDIIALISSLILAAVSPICFFIALLMVALNVFYVNYLNKRLILHFAFSLQQLNILVSVTKQIDKLRIPVINNDKIAASIGVFKKLQQKIGIIYFGYEQKKQADITQLPIYLFDLLKSIFLVEFFTLISLFKSIEKHQQAVRNLFEFIGLIDVAISVASLRASMPTSKPHFIDSSKELTIINGIHPLIPNCVSNSIAIKGKSILLTGSNMSGKTTFLRMIGLNTLMSQTLFTCFAERYEAPMLHFQSSIRIKDDLFSGKSYFFEEVNVIRSLIENVGNVCGNLFILDELFKGTNTVERIAAAKAILTHLNKGNNLVLVSTHDVELTNLLQEEYDLYHFTETVIEENLTFDFKMHAGPLKTRNAIKILELCKLPQEIIKDAQTLSAKLLNDT